MLGKKKKKTGEVRWLITFADLITLLFCFFVYLSLFSKPAVNLDTQFKITENALRILGEVMPLSVLHRFRPSKIKNFPQKPFWLSRLKNSLGIKTLQNSKTKSFWKVFQT